MFQSIDSTGQTDFVVYVALHGAPERQDNEVKLEIVHESDGFPKIVDTVQEAFSGGSGNTLFAIVPLEDLPLEYPGRYNVVISLNGEWVGQRPLFVEEA